MLIRASGHSDRRVELRRWAARFAPIALVILHQPLLAAVITVNGFDSTVADDGVCTLREAITAANSDGATGGCGAGSGADTIQLTGDVTLTQVDNTTDEENGLPSVTTEITLEGANHTITRSGGDSFRFFQVAASGDLTLEDVTLTNGLASDTYTAQGGAIYNRGQLALTNSTISNSQAYVNETNGSEYSARAYGGAIYNQLNADVAITGSTLSGNSAYAKHTRNSPSNTYAWGGAISNKGTVTAYGSTLSGNSVTSLATATQGNPGRDAQAIARGGAIINHGGTGRTLTLINTTLSGNSTYGSATAPDEADVFSRGGGVFAGTAYWGTAFTLANSTLHGNTSTGAAATTGGGSADVFAEGGNLRTATGTHVRYTLIADGDCDGWFSSRILSLTSNTGATCAPADTLTGLSPTLADNGGPTPTHALLAGSNAIDHAGACGLANDQRGALRPGEACDAGAYEYGDVDLTITKDDGTTEVVPGQTLIYILVVTNNGSNGVTGATVSDTFPAALTALNLTGIVTTGGAASSQTTGPFAGSLSDTANLPVGSTITYTVSTTVSAGASGSIENTATVTAPAGYADTNTADNTATDTDSVSTDRDFGDAPDPTYPTLAASNGARHWILPGFQLGAAIDPETDGQASAGADGDDLDAEGDDEDGVTFTSRLRLNVISTTTTVNVTASAAGFLNAWVDFNRDGDWADTGEQIFVDQAVAAGVNGLSFSVPCGYLDLCDTKLGSTYARFRLTLAGGVSYDGLAGIGEVEDYQVEITPDDVVDLFNMSLPDGTYVFYACETILCGGDFTSTPDFDILDASDVLLHAGNLVILKNGVAVREGATLAILQGPVPGCP